MAGMTVLIIDDDAALREGLAETAADLGYEPKLAASGASGLSQLRAQRVDAVLLDLRLGGATGRARVLKAIQALDDPPPVAILTAYATADNTIEAMRLGAFDHLTKPIGRAELADLLKRMTDPSWKRKYQRRIAERRQRLAADFGRIERSNSQGAKNDRALRPTAIPRF